MSTPIPKKYHALDGYIDIYQRFITIESLIKRYPDPVAAAQRINLVINDFNQNFKDALIPPAELLESVRANQPDSVSTTLENIKTSINPALKYFKTMCDAHSDYVEADPDFKDFNKADDFIVALIVIDDKRVKAIKALMSQNDKKIGGNES